MALPKHPQDPATNPSTPAKIELGRLLFFDPILSSSRDVSCATCHHPQFGWGDGRATPIGVGGVGMGPGRLLSGSGVFPVLERNVPTLLNVGFNGLVAGVVLDPAEAPMFWDSRTRSLEEQVLVPLKTRGEMCGEACSETVAVDEVVGRVRHVGGYQERFEAVFPGAKASAVSAPHLAEAIASFERTLVSSRSPFDQFIEGDSRAISDDAQRGLKIFETAGCIQCHGGPMFSDFKLHFIGVPDSITGGRREIRTPTLRNLRHTAPYMHNASLRTLRDVLVFYEALSDSVSETLDGGDTSGSLRLDPLLKHLNLGADEFLALEAFLETLNAEDYPRSVPQRVPSGLPVAQ